MLTLLALFDLFALLTISVILVFKFVCFKLARFAIV